MTTSPQSARPDPSRESAPTYEAVKKQLGADPEALPRRSHAAHMERVRQAEWLEGRLAAFAAHRAGTLPRGTGRRIAPPPGPSGER
ncbi:hypothetical protein JK386_09685 [Nocardioides sp. zg-536]|uniref:Uncharacterized protein n=1 Tax=Nocardioides faecalis TaxID=2803858 RepID=A0A938YAA5_9ACTN|nr:hypothetical protein [Nocardioides faecalis]MBM9460174.1 hypothetical protein [Nocardioides faecalis]MBS4754273.1 hypothetical protein [Nocardioides faecalis]QVI60031.1 hypothetical protein KG111_06920 [Nocardioides faecalis]